MGLDPHNKVGGPDQGPKEQEQGEVLVEGGSSEPLFTG